MYRVPPPTIDRNAASLRARMLRRFHPGPSRPLKDLTLWAIAVPYIVLRQLSMLGASPVLLPDSATWRQAPNLPTHDFVSLTGEAMRGWVVPLFFALLPSDEWRMVGQFVVSVVSWLVFATIVSRTLTVPVVRVVAFVTILALSCATPVASWDRAILADSLSISLTALTLGAWIVFVRRPSIAASAVLVATTVLWLFTKPTLFAEVSIAAVVLLTIAMFHQRSRMTYALTGVTLAVAAA